MCKCTPVENKQASTLTTWLLRGAGGTAAGVDGRRWSAVGTGVELAFGEEETTLGDSHREIPRAAMGTRVAAIKQAGDGPTGDVLACRWRFPASGRDAYGVDEGGGKIAYTPLQDAHRSRAQDEDFATGERFAGVERAIGRLALGRRDPCGRGQSASLVCHVSKLGAKAGWQWTVVSSRPQRRACARAKHAGLKRGHGRRAPAATV